MNTRLTHDELEELIERIKEAFSDYTVKPYADFAPFDRMVDINEQELSKILES